MKQNVSSLKKKADKYFSLYVRYRDGGFKRGQWLVECITCGVEKPLKQMQLGHFVSRRVNALRYDEENCNAQCTGCNMFKQGEQYLYAKALDLKYGDGKAEELMSRRFETHKLSIAELEGIINDSKEQIKFYERTTK
jgi:5-methylcytosine-specific restriction endonuclease McrA